MVNGNARNSLLGKVGSYGKNNSSNVLQKQGTLTLGECLVRFTLNCDYNNQ